MRLLLAFALLAGCTASDPSAGVDGMPGSGDDAPPGGTDARLHPLEVGRTWTYDVTSTYPSCPGGVREMRVVSSGTTDGRATFEVTGLCGLTGHTSVDGDRVDEYYDWGPMGWMRALDAPVADGHSWETTNGSATFTMTYAAAGSVAGHPDCWKVTQNVSYTSYWIYCRAVGLVRYEMIDLAGGTIRADLTATSF